MLAAWPIAATGIARCLTCLPLVEELISFSISLPVFMKPRGNVIITEISVLDQICLMLANPSPSNCRKGESGEMYSAIE